MADHERPEPAPEPTADPVLEPTAATAEPVVAPSAATAEPVAATEAEPAPAAESTPSRGRQAAVISLRVVRGLAGIAAALAVIAAVGLLPQRELGIDPLGIEVTPQPADPQLVCTGSVLRLGSVTGDDAGTPVAVGTPAVTASALEGGVDRTPLAESDAGTGGGNRAPLVLTIPAGADAALGGAQSQRVDSDGLRGFAAAACTEATGSAWLVGGATTLGRTSILVLANPTEVAAEVTLSVWGEEGAVQGPGMSGITVAPSSQRIIPLSGFAPDLTSPIVHVEARGGRVAASLQTTITRVLDPSGVDVVGAGSAPARESVVPGVRIHDARGIGSAIGLDDYADLDAIARIGNPGTTDATVEVGVTPASDGAVGASFELTVPAGGVTDIPLASASDALPDGTYTVTFRSDEPVVTGVRASTAVAPTSRPGAAPVAGAADLAWFASAPVIGVTPVLAVADAPGAQLTIANPGAETRVVRLDALRGTDFELEVPAGSSASIAVAPGTAYRVLDADGLHASVSFADAGTLAGYPVISPRAADAPILVRP